MAMIMTCTPLVFGWLATNRTSIACVVEQLRELVIPLGRAGDTGDQRQFHWAIPLRLASMPPLPRKQFRSPDRKTTRSSLDA